MKPWLKGGIIGIVVGLIILILGFVVPLIWRLNPITWIIRECNEAGCILFLLTTPIFYLLFGIFVGWVIGKINPNK